MSPYHEYVYYDPPDWPEGCTPFKSGFSCFSKPRWVPEDECYHSYSSRQSKKKGCRLFCDIGIDSRSDTRRHDQEYIFVHNEGVPSHFHGHREWVPGFGWSYYPPSSGRPRPGQHSGAGWTAWQDCVVDNPEV